MGVQSVSTRTDTAIDAALWVAGVGFGLLTLLYSLIVTPPQGGAFSVSDKALHVTAYFVTSLCLLLAAVWRPGRGDGPFAGWALRGAVALVAAGALIEVLQGTLTSRDAEIADVLADLIGVGAALALHTLLRMRSAAKA